MDRRQTQYTLRNVAPAVDQALRRRARRLGRSQNDVALEALARGVGIEAEASAYDDLDRFFGSWVEDRAVDRALAEQRTSDGALWR